jgi:RNA polymerase sigma factor for flagellar operon FliA
MLSPKARRLVVEHLPLVGRVARHLRRRYHLDVATDELESFGQFGLVEAASRFDPGRGCSFPAFALPRIRGAILDGIGELASTPRPRRGRSAPHAPPRHHESLASNQVDAEQVLRKQRLCGALHTAIHCLPERSRLLVEKRYFQHRKLVDIGHELGVSKSRASRLHAAALRRLRHALAETMSVGEDTLDAELAQLA